MVFASFFTTFYSSRGLYMGGGGGDEGGHMSPGSEGQIWLFGGFLNSDCLKCSLNSIVWSRPLKHLASKFNADLDLQHCKKTMVAKTLWSAGMLPVDRWASWRTSWVPPGPGCPPGCRNAWMADRSHAGFPSAAGWTHTSVPAHHKITKRKNGK